MNRLNRETVSKARFRRRVTKVDDGFLSIFVFSSILVSSNEPERLSSTFRSMNNSELTLL